MGRNHHISIKRYVRLNSSSSLIDRAYWFIYNKETSPVSYSKIRTGICYHQNVIDDVLRKSKTYYKKQYPQPIIRRLKNTRKDLSIVLDKLDKYMEYLIRR